MRAMTGLLVLLLASICVAAPLVSSRDAQLAVLQQHNLTVSKQNFWDIFKKKSDRPCHADADCNPGETCVRRKKRQNPD